MAKTKADLLASEMLWTGHQKQCRHCAPCDPFARPALLAMSCGEGSRLVREFLALSHQFERAKTLRRARAAARKHVHEEPDLLTGIAGVPEAPPR